MSGPSPTLVLAQLACGQARGPTPQATVCFEQDLWQMCAHTAHTSSPLHTRCERIERFLPELFVFVAVPGVPAEYNLVD